MNVQLLTEDFIAGYEGIKPPWTEIGLFTYYRTYSRWLPEKGRREYWIETVRRAVEYNVSLMFSENDLATNEVVLSMAREEAEKLFDNMYMLRQFLSGRTLFVGGTEVSYKYPMSNFNCSFQVIDRIEAFEQGFYLLMIGTGYGFRILQDDVDKLPAFRTNVLTHHEDYVPVPKHRRQEHTTTEFMDSKTARIVVGDSKEAWTEALAQYFRLLTHNNYRQIETIFFNYNNIREKGERLKTFGGTASGHTSLKNMFVKIDRVFKGQYADAPVNGKLRPIHVLDIMNIIGENVVVGGVRRTSEIALIDVNDKETLYAKKDLTEDKYHRFMSNNSIYYTEKPTREQVALQFKVLRYEGEPAFVNAVAAGMRRPNFAGVNPCVEILLASMGLCNLTTVNVMAFIKDGVLDLEGLLEAQRLSARAGYRMTCVTLELFEWDAINKRDRLTGCSVTGWKDAVEALDYSKEQEHVLQKLMHEAAREAADELADLLGTPRSLLVTAVKPEGTLSLVAGAVSSGLHHAHSEYYIRRIRVNSNDPLVQVAMELGWTMHNEVGQGIEINGEYVPVTTVVIDFPVYSPVKRTKYEVSALEQLQTYYDFQDNYTEHNSSNTITVKEHEWEEVEQYIYDRWEDMVAVSFLKLDGHSYALAPYEAIDKATYEAMKSAMKEFDPELLHKYETQETEFDGGEACEGGACPVR